MAETEARFNQVLEAAYRDPNVLAFWLDGSRGKGVTTSHSDYDCTMIVKDEVLDEYRKKFENLGDPKIELSVYTFDGFRQHAACYNFSHLKALVDKTGEAQQLIDSKGSVLSPEASKIIHRALDHYINQVYRSLKCFRDGQQNGARLEAAEGINPLLDAVFALNGRIRPYFKYLEWELKNYPLPKLGITHAEFTEILLEILTSADIKVQQNLLSRIELLFRAEGYEAVFDGWGKDLFWMKTYSPET
jgi:hypothetical protein